MDAEADLEFGSYMPNVQVCVHWLWEECLPKDAKDVCVFLFFFFFFFFFLVCLFFFFHLFSINFPEEEERSIFRDHIQYTQ